MLTRVDILTYASRPPPASSRRSWVNRNNHPIRAGDAIGIHNGTIYNADYLFRRIKLRRFAEVDDIISDLGLWILN